MNQHIFYLQGGLGNQLFIYYAAAAYCLKNKIDIITFDTSGLSRANTKRALEIDKFDLPIPYQVSNSSHSKIARALLIRLHGLSPKLLNNLGFFRTNEVGFDGSLLSQEFRDMSGHFQSWRYHEQVCMTFPEHNLRVKRVSKWTAKKIEEVKEKNPILCHLRRGDYLDLEDAFGVLSYEYYKNALHEFRTKGITAPVWIVTDSPELISETFLKEMQAEIMEEPENVTAAEVFCVMQSCNHFIISNSTFSWWAAFTSESSNVVSPKPWFKNLKEPLDLIPDGWLRIDSTWV